jgi:hypothetical protein
MAPEPEPQEAWYPPHFVARVARAVEILDDGYAADDRELGWVCFELSKVVRANPDLMPVGHTKLAAIIARLLS